MMVQPPIKALWMSGTSRTKTAWTSTTIRSLQQNTSSIGQLKNRLNCLMNSGHYKQFLLSNRFCILVSFCELIRLLQKPQTSSKYILLNFGFFVALASLETMIQINQSLMFSKSLSTMSTLSILSARVDICRDRRQFCH